MDYTHEQLVALWERHSLGTPQDVTPLGGHTLLVDDIVLRRHPSVLTQTAYIYRRLRAAELPVPEVVALDTGHGIFDEDVLLLRHVPGTNGAKVWPLLDAPAREALSEQLGQIVAKIHNLRWMGYGTYEQVLASGEARLGMYPRWNEVLNQRLVGVVEQMGALDIVPRSFVDGVIMAINDGDALLGSASPPVLTHGALGWHHVVLDQVDGQWRIAALLGWDAALAADAAWEWAQLWLLPGRHYPEPDCFVSGYRSIRTVQPDRAVRVAMYRLLLHLEGARTAHRRGDLPSRDRHIAALARAFRAA